MPSRAFIPTRNSVKFSECGWFIFKKIQIAVSAHEIYWSQRTLLIVTAFVSVAQKTISALGERSDLTGESCGTRTGRCGD